MKKTVVTKRKISKSQIMAIIAAILMVVQNYIDLSDIVPYLNQIIEGICGILVMVGVIADGGQKTVETVDPSENEELPAVTQPISSTSEILETHTYNLPERGKYE